MGGTPAVKMLREAMVGDEVEPVAGILNGTCNYILTEMEATGRAFADVLAEAQRLGYAEADPDHGRRRLRRRPTRSPSWRPWRSAARRTTPPPRSRASRRSSCSTSAWPSDLGYRIKLVASALNARRTASRCSVHPALAPLDHPLAQAGGRAERALHRGQAHRPHLHPGAGRGRGPDRRRRRRRHRRRDDRRRAAGLPGAGRRAEALRAGRRQPTARAAPICACWCATSPA